MKKVTQKVIGDIKALREHFSTSETADLLGISQATVYRAEQGNFTMEGYRAYIAKEADSRPDDIKEDVTNRDILDAINALAASLAKPKKGPNEYNKFVSYWMKRGKSMQEISDLWGKRKRAQFIRRK